MKKSELRQIIREEIEKLSERFYVDDFDYRASHGKAPKGRGSWAFTFEHPSSRKYLDPWFAPSNLTYADAKKAAAKEAKKRGASQAWALG